jgi:uncharacterized protein
MISGSRKLRVIIDTNVFVSSLLNKHGQPFALIEAWYADQFTLLMSAEQRAELQDVISRSRLIKRYHLSPLEAYALLTHIDRWGQLVTGVVRVPVAVRDVKDEKILASAIKGVADYLITGDNDLLILDGNPALGMLKIVTVRDFLGILSSFSWL